MHPASYPGAPHPISSAHNLRPPAPSGQPYHPALADNLDYGEMADMLYNQMEMDPSESLFTPRPSYTDPYFRVVPPGSGPAPYAQHPMGLPSGLPHFHSPSPLDLSEDIDIPEIYDQERSSSSHTRSSRSRHH
ncbi:hypothetical protein RhiJN_05538 [Ceratobasidium sp. AG-Ba]|nr:hypothetical protein RhiJN_05538 [Ceratobasidium sp. AG-Ba]